jgi:carbamoyl-phosphate synthase large subunit
VSARERTAEPVLVPGAGSAAGVGAIKALRMAGFRGQIVATDADPMAPGLELADVGAVLPRAAAPEFLPRALDLIRREGVRVILPTSSFDTPVYAAARAELANAGATLVACDPDAIESCLDRRRFVERFAGSFPLPRTVAADVADTIGFPCVARAARALGGRAASICGDAEALERRLAYGDDVIVQAYQPGVEYAVDVLGDLEGRPLVAVPRLRLAVHDGSSVRGHVVHDDEIEDLCLRLASALEVRGPVCMQLRRNAGGYLRVLEVQPRLGGASFFTTLAGVNLAALAVDLAAGRALPSLRFVEISVARYFEEVVMIGTDRRRRAARPVRALG